MDNNKDNNNENIIIESDRYDSKYIQDEPSNNEQKKKKKPKKKRGKFVTFLKWFAIISLLLILIGGGVGTALAYSWIKDAPPLDLSLFEYLEPTEIVDINGDFYQELQGKEKREILSIEEIPKNVQNAFIDIEDERFSEHNGFDIQGLVRAGIGVITSQSLSGPGGSTITQQLIKLTQLEDRGILSDSGTANKTLQRKVIEIYLAMQLERQYTKDQILESYLNKVGFAYAWGVQAASETYFNKNVQDLTIAQSAVLASIIKSPTYYKPYIIEEVEEGVFQISTEEDGRVTYNERNQIRALAVVSKMHELGHISLEEKNEATEQLKNNDFGLGLPPEDSLYSFFTDTLYEQVLDDLMESENFNFEDRDSAEYYLLNSGLKIYSTIDPEVQNVLDKKFEDDSLFPKQSYTAKKASEALSSDLGEKINYTPEGAVTVIENSTGYVVGLIGGRDKDKNRSLNRATQQFQVGSATKPLTVYGPGLDSKQITLATTFDDVPIRAGGRNIGNSPNTFNGMTIVREGLFKSKNTIAIQAVHKIGFETSIKYAEALGLDLVKPGERDDGKDDYNDSALGLGGYTDGQSTFDMASAYSTFPNGGVRIEPVLYTRIEDRDGNTVLDNQQEKNQVFSPQTAFLITDVLKDVVKGGTTNLYVPNVNSQIAGKTGTTNNQMHAYFAGFTPEYTAAVWFGYDQNIIKAGGKTYELNIGKYGGESTGSPANMWESIMRAIYKNKKAGKLPGNPGGIVSASIDSVSGKRPTELTAKDPRGSTVISEMFISGTVPSETDDYHVELLIDMSTGKIASEFCPEDLVEKVVRIKKPDDRFPGSVRPQNKNYVPKSEKGILAPEEDDICTVHNAQSVIGVNILVNNKATDSITIHSGNSQQIKVVGIDNAKGFKENISNLTVTSNNQNITISSDGKGLYTIKGVTVGNSKVTATATYKYTTTIGDKKEEKTYTYTKSLNVAVSEPPVPPTVTLSVNDISLTVGDAFIDPKVLVNGKATNDYTRTITNTGTGKVVTAVDTSAPNNYSILYKATDNNDLTGTSPPLIVRIIAPPPTTPVESGDKGED